MGGLGRAPKAAENRKVTAGFIIASGSTLRTPKPSTPRGGGTCGSVVTAELAKNGIDGTVDAAAYFSTQQ